MLAIKYCVIQNILFSHLIALRNVSLRLAILIGATMGLSTQSVASPGQLDPTFGNGGISFLVPPTLVPPSIQTGPSPAAYIVESQNSYVVSGSCPEQTSPSALVLRRFCVAKLSLDGSFDLSFGAGGWVVISPAPELDAQLTALASLVDGRILVVGTCGRRFCAVRLLPNGLLDTSFGSAGKLLTNLPVIEYYSSGAHIDQNGDFFITGRCYTPDSNFCVAKFSASGVLDASYGTGGVAIEPLQGNLCCVTPSSVMQPDGKIVLASACDGPFRGDTCWVRFLTDGHLDVSFGQNGHARMPMGLDFEIPTRIVVDSHGRILTISQCWNSMQYEECIARLMPNGDLDDSFGFRGVSAVPGYLGWRQPMGVASVGGGKSVSVAYCTNALVYPPQPVPCLARYLEDGTLDVTFGSNGNLFVPLINGAALDLYVTPAGKLVVAGSCGVDKVFCVMRLKGGPYDTLTCTLNLDANPTIDPATDALLITRYLLGYRGDALTTGAVGASPIRTNAEIETYLGTLMQAGKLDVDGDGQSLAMTDGLLLVRAMLGLSGTALTNGATNAAHPNARNAQQILTWIETTHGVACLP